MSDLIFYYTCNLCKQAFRSSKNEYLAGTEKVLGWGLQVIKPIVCDRCHNLENSNWESEGGTTFQKNVINQLNKLSEDEG